MERIKKKKVKSHSTLNGVTQVDRPAKVLCTNGIKQAKVSNKNTKKEPNVKKKMNLYEEMKKLKYDYSNIKK